MMYKDLLNVQKQKLMKSLTWIFGVPLLISLMLAIFSWITKNDSLIWVGLITIVLLYAWLIPWAWSNHSLYAQKLKKYVDENPSNDPISIIANSYLKGGLEESIEKAGFQKISHGLGYDNHGNTEFGIRIIDGKKQFILEYVQNKWKWFAGDSKIEEQDTEDDQWTTIDFKDLNVNSIEDIIAIIKQLYDLSDIQE